MEAGPSKYDDKAQIKVIIIANFEDGRRPKVKEFRQPLEAIKGMKWLFT